MFGFSWVSSLLLLRSAQITRLGLEGQQKPPNRTRFGFAARIGCVNRETISLAVSAHLPCLLCEFSHDGVQFCQQGGSHLQERVTMRSKFTLLLLSGLTLALCRGAFAQG